MKAPLSRGFLFERSWLAWILKEQGKGDDYTANEYVLAIEQA